MACGGAQTEVFRERVGGRGEAWGRQRGGGGQMYQNRGGGGLSGTHSLCTKREPSHGAAADGKPVQSAAGMRHGEGEASSGRAGQRVVDSHEGETVLLLRAPRSRCRQKWPQSMSPFVDFMFSRHKIRVWGGGGGAPPTVVRRSDTSPGGGLQTRARAAQRTKTFRFSPGTNPESFACPTSDVHWDGVEWAMSPARRPHPLTVAVPLHARRERRTLPPGVGGVPCRPYRVPPGLGRVGGTAPPGGARVLPLLPPTSAVRCPPGPLGGGEGG